MSLPADGVNANALAETTTIPTGKKLTFLDPDTNEGGIITLENLTKQILSNLATQTFDLDQGTKTLLAALNELNSNAKLVEKTIENSESLISPVWVRKLGHIAWVNYPGDAAKIDAGGWHELFTLPAEFYPMSLIRSNVRSIVNAAIMVDGTGKVKYYATTSVERQTNFQFSLCYFTK